MPLIDCSNYQDFCTRSFQNSAEPVKQQNTLHFNQDVNHNLLSWLHACVDPSGDNPGPRGNCSFYEALAHHLLDARVQLKVLNPSVDRDEDLGKLHVPLLQHQPQDALRPSVVGQTHILSQEKNKQKLTWAHSFWIWSKKLFSIAEKFVLNYSLSSDDFPFLNSK